MRHSITSIIPSSSTANRTRPTPPNPDPRRGIGRRRREMGVRSYRCVATGVEFQVAVRQSITRARRWKGVANNP
ncbi:BZ3500_MvSof-1268-A1-R1_Chr3-1g05608 [Microbotryum saponariae]|uniref:BZ3500_MvSof-1268-A1-R1_Chr3-1g05608 protein n=1 Tax=Microbotryum saponariae TaxID=289078 RepID=A0A2X0MW96_9BASI|nr:BZ3500_MvSof-1268-A1-R1_Chr3-1g05608 [Microbotryum saponariae]SDA04798.1 BZ3501_MvSof-1269-A2-R1_Chr3-1g05278 [Microbotryum saponariae]